MNRKKKASVVVKGLEYSVILEPDLEEGGFIVKCPSVSKGCVSQGETEEEALEMIKDAIEGILAQYTLKNRSTASLREIGDLSAHRA